MSPFAEPEVNLELLSGGAPDFVRGEEEHGVGDIVGLSPTLG
jgi:hypothetical protein